MCMVVLTSLPPSVLCFSTGIALSIRDRHMFLNFLFSSLWAAAFVLSEEGIGRGRAETAEGRRGTSPVIRSGDGALRVPLVKESL